MCLKPYLLSAYRVRHDAPFLPLHVCLLLRLLIKGRLLQLLLPCEVCPDASSAQRSTIAGTLQVRWEYYSRVEMHNTQCPLLPSYSCVHHANLTF